MADPTLDEMMNDLAAADAAGDTELAQRIAGRIKAARGPKIGMGDVQAAPSAKAEYADTSILPPWPPVSGPKAEIQALQMKARGYTKPYDPKISGAVAAGAVTPELLGPILGGAVGGGLTSGALTDWDPANAAVGAAAGGAGGFLIPKAIKGLAALRPGQRLLRLITPKVQPTEEAARLMKQGVPLTTGQLQPDSLVNAFEQASDKAPLGMGNKREAAREAWRALVLKQPLAPGQAAAKGGTAEQLEALYQGFEPQYAPIKAAPVPEGALDDLPGQALKSPRAVDARTRGEAAGEIKNALTILPGAPKPPPVEAPIGPSSENVLRPAPVQPVPSSPSSTVGDLIKVRSNIREQLRAAQKAQDWAKMRILGHAADTVSDAINGHLDDAGRQALQATDARYHIFNVVEDAANRSGMSGDFTPKQLGAALKVAEGRRSFTQGGGDALRRLAQDAEAVFTPTVQPTGERLTIPGVLPQKLVAPLARLANTTPVREAMLRVPLAPPQLSPGVGAELSPLAAYLAAMKRLGVPGLTPAAAEEGP